MGLALFSDSIGSCVATNRSRYTSAVQMFCLHIPFFSAVLQSRNFPHVSEFLRRFERRWGHIADYTIADAHIPLLANFSSLRWFRRRSGDGGSQVELLVLHNRNNLFNFVIIRKLWLS